MRKKKTLEVETRMNCKIFLLLFALYCTLLSCCYADIFQAEDFKMLACSEQRNITIIIDGVYQFFLDPFLFLFNNVIGNEDCFSVYVYDSKYDDSILLRKGMNPNHLDLSLRDGNSYLIPYVTYPNTVNFLKRKLKERKKSKQTIVYMAVDNRGRDFSHHYELLKKLHKEYSCDVIVFCSRGSCPTEIWMPPYRIILFPLLYDGYRMYDSLDSLQIIKEPEYDPYEFAYQSICSKYDFFNQTCLAGIKTIHITMRQLSTFYFPMAVAILRKENSERRKMNKELLKIKFHYNHWWNPKPLDIFRRIASKVDQNLLIGFFNYRTMFEKEDQVSLKWSCLNDGVNKVQKIFIVLKKNDI